MSRPQRVALGPGGVWLGILVTHLTFCILYGIRYASGPGNDAWLTILAFIVGAIPAIGIGWSLAMPLGVLLQPVRHQWLHVAAFGLLGCALGLPFGGFGSPADFFAAAAMGTAAAAGRLSLWKLARVSDDGGRPPAVVHPVSGN